MIDLTKYREHAGKSRSWLDSFVADSAKFLDPRTFDAPDPLVSGMEKSPSGLWVPTPTEDTTFDVVFEKERAKPLPPEDPDAFEVNLAEALVGWRSWDYHFRLGSPFCGTIWKPLEPCVARCNRRKSCVSPEQYCTCGIYAVNDRVNAPVEDSDVVGTVHGWGKYVRSDNGWRAQYAYPRSFHLHADQAPLVQSLMEFRVPIYVETEQQMYDPKEDGYASGGDEANRDCGAIEEPGPDED